ncbi:expressed protein [Chlorella variabilis]|uniref:Expressed protein n=1 Tax=Chlorella variabilis TaxID=554065 RepID=E1Z4Q3_CHLVA|nr:expressed protein [Chlorella variabilis]EFN59389.1 expressed protein [Chlorella variabilis]|eukprot:XP_005851491.1 expressed protein [Chlorella variabilis]
MARVILVPPLIDEGVLMGPPPRPAFGRHSASQAPAESQSAVTGAPMLFHLEGFELEEAAVTDPVSESAARTRQTVARLLQPGADDQSLYSAVMMATQAGGGSLDATAQVLARLGYTVKLSSSAGGTLRSLKHTFLTATRNTFINGEPAEWIIDPSFASAFAVACPTPRFAHILEAVPPVLVAPLPRLVRALLLLGAELARCFEKQGIPLPPWRHADAITTKYDAVSSVVVHGSGEASAAAAAGGPGPAAPQVAAAAAARKQQRDRQQLERVHVRLARLGVVSDLPAPLPPSTSPSSGGTPTTGADKGAVDSPRSVLEAADQGSASQRVVGFEAKAPDTAVQQRQLHDAAASTRPRFSQIGWPGAGFGPAPVA